MNEQHDPRLDEALEALRRSLTQPLEEDVAKRHLAAMRDAARTERPASWWVGLRERSALRRDTMPGLTPRWLVAGAAGLLAFVSGLAVAGNLPDPAQHFVAQTVSNIGLDLPDPDDEPNGKGHGEEGEGEDGDDPTTADSNNEHGKTVSSVARDDSLEGCEHGQAVREVASSKSQGDEDAPGRSPDHDPCTNDDESDDEGTEGPGDSGEHSQGAGEGPDDDSPSATAPGRAGDDDDDDDGPGNSGDAGEGHGGQPGDD